MKLLTVVNVFEGATKLATTKDIPFTLSWKVKTYIKALQAHVENYEEERKAIIDKYKTTDDEGKEIIPKDSIDTVNAEITKLGEIEIENLTLPKIKLSEIGEVKVDGNLAFLLEEMIEE